uniref:Reverse transcriptase domain-containing protein n=1 Tax=Rhodosorus marinus TaxID=101924 RepID=A0A7S2ZBN8_9RHOD
MLPFVLPRTPSTRGGSTGRTLGSFFARLLAPGRLLSLRSEVPEIRVVGYHDDVCLVGPPDSLAAAYERLLTLASLVSLEVNHAKSFYWGGQDTPELQVPACFVIFGVGRVLFT